MSACTQTVRLVHTDVTSWEERRPEANTYLREWRHRLLYDGVLEREDL